METLFQKMFGPDMIWVAFIQIQLAVVFLWYFILTLYRHLVIDRAKQLKESVDETQLRVVGHMDRILDEYFNKEYHAFQLKHGVKLDGYSTRELLALCEQKGWTDEVFYSILFVDYNEFNYE